MGNFRARPRANGYEIDVKAPDGFLLGGWRKVCKGGYLRFHRGRWTHPELTEHVGEYVFVHVDCCWATAASWTADYDQKWAPPGASSGGRKPLDPADGE